MASNSGNAGGLLVVGVVLAVAAITINAGRGEVSPQPDSNETTRVENAAPAAVDANTAIGDQQRMATTAIGDQQRMATSTESHGKVDYANDSNFQQKVLDVPGRVLVDFYADWCGPCRMIAPVLSELAQEEPSARIVKVNVDHSPNLARQFRIESIPALIVFENGQPVSRQLGVVDKEQLRTMLGL